MWVRIFLICRDAPYIASKGRLKNMNFVSFKIRTSKATVNDARYKVSRIVKLVEIVEIKVDCHFYFYYALVGLYSANFFC